MGEEDVKLQVEGHAIMSKKTMTVLGMEFDNDLSWEPQMRRVMASCQRMKPALRSLKQKLKRRELLQVITSHYYPRLYYGSEVWYHSLKMCNKNRLKALHYYPLRLAIGDFKRQKSNKVVSELCKRASPFEFNNYKVAKLIVSIVSNTNPYFLFHVLLSQAVVESRKETQPWFLDMSRSRRGRQSFANRITAISKQINFPWLGVAYSKDHLRNQLKKSFFHHSVLA